MKNDHDGFWIVLCCITLLFSSILYDFYSVPGNSRSHVIGVTSMTLNNPFYEVINNELRKATESRGDRLMILDPMLDASKQEEQIETMIRNRVDAIILNPVDSSALQKPLADAREAGIPVIVVDSSVQQENLIDTTIVSKNREAGKLCARAMMEDLPEGKILLLEHSQADSARERIEGFLEEIENAPQYEVITRAECEGQLEQAMPKTAQALEEHPEINVIMALNDPSALGAAAAAESLEREDLYIYGVDGTPDFKTRMQQDFNLKATVAQSPYKMAAQAAESAYKLMEGKMVPDLQLVSVSLIRKDDVHEENMEVWQ